MRRVHFNRLKGWLFSSIKNKKAIASCLLLMCLTLSCYAQIMVNKNRVIVIEDQANITVQGGVENDGFLINNGLLEVSGNWQNPGSYNPGEGLMRFNGLEDQNISHNNQSFFDLEFNGGGQKLLLDSALVDNSVDFRQGIVTPNASFVIGESAQVLGGSELSHVNGRLYHRGTGFKFFPIGKNNNFLPFELVDVAGISPLIGVEVFEPNPNPQPDNSLELVSTNRFWELNVVEGQYDGSQVSLALLNEEPTDNLGLLVVSQAEELEGVFSNLGQSNLLGDFTNGFLTSELPGTASLYALAIDRNLEQVNDLLFVPNFMSLSAPNEDDSSMRIYGNEISAEQFILRVFNRWGIIVFETRDLDVAKEIGWTGINSNTGNQEPLGVYAYAVSGLFLSGESFQKSGTITMID